MNKVLFILLIATCVSPLACASDLVDLEKARRFNVLQINQTDETSLGEIPHSSLRNMPIDILREIVGRVLPRDIIRLYIAGDKNLRYSLPHSVDGGDLFEPPKQTSLKFFFETFDQIKSLSLFRHNLKELPQEMALLQNLKILELFQTPFADRKLPTIILTLFQLEELKVLGCRLREIPENMSSLKNLKELDLTGNGYADAKFFQAFLGLSCLEILTLICCNVSELPENISFPENLKILTFSANNSCNEYSVKKYLKKYPDLKIRFN